MSARVLLGLAGAAVGAGCSVEEDLARTSGSVHIAQSPTDPLASLQWSYSAIGLPSAWDLTTGTPNIRIAIIDTGRAPHEDLNAKWAAGLEYDAFAQDSSAVDAALSHASHVAAIAAGGTNNGRGGASVCWGCQLLAIDVMDGQVTDSGGRILNVQSLPRAIRWAVENGAQVINMSLGSSPDQPQPCSDPIYGELRAALAFAESNKVSVVAAAGNFSSDVAATVPASCPGVISVAATDHNGALASYSNFGAVTVAAPGGGGTFQNNEGFGASLGCPADALSRFTPDTVGIVSAWTTTDGTPCYRYYSGTSMATPHVAGVIGLMLSRNPTLTPAQIRALLVSTARPIPSCSHCTFGMVDAYAAVRNAAPLPAGDAPPEPRFTYTCWGMSCSFDGSASTDAQGIVAHQWIFPGQRSNGSTASTFLPGYGAHEVRLRVTDTTGQSRELMQLVTVSPQPVTPRVGSYTVTGKQGPSIELYETADGNWVLGWYTFELIANDSVPVWYNSAVGPITNGRFQQPLYRYTRISSGVPPTQAQVGTIALDFSGSQTAWASWVLHGISGGERYQFNFGGEGRSGIWYSPVEPGWGFAVQESSWYLNAIVTFYYNGQPRWMRGSGWSSASSTLLLQYLSGPGLCPSCGGKGVATSDPSWSSPTQSSMTLQIADGTNPSGGAETGIYKNTPIQPLGIWVRSMRGVELLTKP